MNGILAATYNRITRFLIKNGLTVSTMESCTSGTVVSLLTDTEGSSAVVKGGLVTYCNDAKMQNGVPAEVIETYGVYSEQTALAMAKACRASFGTDLGIGVTGSYANPDPNNQDSRPGTVCFAISTPKDECAFTVGITAPTRRECKEKTAFAIAEKLSALLGIKI